jgi:hypothetical protein
MYGLLNILSEQIFSFSLLVVLLVFQVDGGFTIVETVVCIGEGCRWRRRRE